MQPIDLRELRFRPQFIGVVDISFFYDQGMEYYCPRVRRDLAVAPVGNDRRTLAPRAPANHIQPVALEFKHLAGR